MPGDCWSRCSRAPASRHRRDRRLLAAHPARIRARRGVPARPLLEGQGPRPRDPIVPFVQQMVRMDLRTRVLDVPPQDVISRDNVSVKVNAVVYYRVIDPEKAIIQVEEFDKATSQFAQTTLRSVVGQHELDEMLAEREKLNAEVQRILDEQNRRVGDQGQQRRAQAHRSQRDDDPRHRQAGRGRATAGAPRSSTPRASCRLRSGCCRPARSSPSGRRRCSCAISAPCSTSPAKRAPPSFFRCRWTWQARSGLDRRKRTEAMVLTRLHHHLPQAAIP